MSSGNVTFCTRPPRRTGGQPEPFIAQEMLILLVFPVFFKKPEKPFTFLETVHSQQ